MIYVLAFIFGACLGSFANVLADRVGVKKILNDRSACLSCGNKLSWQELIPIFSYLYQRGRCKKCKSAIPLSLLISEIICGILLSIFIPIAISFSIIPLYQFLYFILIAFIICISTAIITYDIRHMSVPYQFIAPLFFLCLAVMIMNFYVKDFSRYNLLSPIIISLPFTLLYLYSRGRWVGLGDVILYFCFGMILSLPAAISSFFYSVWIGAFVSLFLLFMYKKDYHLKSEVPFTPFIIIGALISLYFNPDILYIKDLIYAYENL